MNITNQRYMAKVCVLLLALPAGGFGQNPAPAQTQPQTQPPAPANRQPMKEDNGLRGHITAPYRPAIVPPNDLTNSPRIESLIRAGNLYLSLQDTIALA